MLSTRGIPYMIDALFNQPGFLATSKSLDAVELRGQAIANNLANLETPGYRRVDLSPGFEAALNKAILSQNPQQIASLNPTLAAEFHGVQSLAGRQKPRLIEYRFDHV